MPRRNQRAIEPPEHIMTEDERVENALLDALAALGGQRVRQDSLKFEGKELILPETMDVDDAIGYLQDWRDSQMQETAYSRTFQYRPHDGAHALQSAMVKVFGTAGIQRPTWTFFGRQPPEQISINIGPDRTTQVPWGRITIPIFEGVMTIGAKNHKELGPLFHLGVIAAKKFAPHVEGLFRIVQDELAHYSIYRGQAVDGQDEPEFLDLRGVDPTKVIYSDSVMAQLEANIWSLIRYTNMQRRLGLPLKRANLLFGPYGTGKTLAGFRTAQIATENGWTTIYCRPGRDDLIKVMGTARLYQPCVVFMEDVDTIASGVESDPVTRILDILDGISAKGTEIMVVMTTNHAQRIHQGMLRPGRLDSIIEIAALDVHGIQRMIESVVPEKMIDSDDLDYEAIHEAMEGFLPAFVKETIDRAIRYAVVRLDGKRPSKLETEDFVNAAVGLRPQWTMMHGAKEGTTAPSLDTALADIVRQEAHAVLDGAPIGPSELDPEEMPWKVHAASSENGS